MLRALTLDYWDTIYSGASEPRRKQRRQEALFHVLAGLDPTISQAAFEEVYQSSAEEAHRWWRDDHRGYSTLERIRWMLQRLQVSASLEGERLTRAQAAVDDALIEIPAPLLPGAREAIAALSERYALAIISDTGFASGRAQDRLLEADGLRSYFAATIYSMDVGRAKPRAEIFQAALDALGVPPAAALHVGDNERTDVGGALAIGMRAIRLDAVRENGESKGEYVARSLGALAEYLLQAGRRVDG